jgi:uncharacterized RmlC-like cupin family protein
MNRTRSLVTIALFTSALAGCQVNKVDEQQSNSTANAATPAKATASNEPPLALAAADPALQWGPCPEGMPLGCGIAVLHGDPAKPNADIFLRVPGGSSIPPHAHSSAERMILVNGELEVKYEGAPAATLRAGHYAYGPAERPHRADCRSSEPCTLFIAFEGPVDVLPVQGEMN